MTTDIDIAIVTTLLLSLYGDNGYCDITTVNILLLLLYGDDDNDYKTQNGRNIIFGTYKAPCQKSSTSDYFSWTWHASISVTHPIQWVMGLFPGVKRPGWGPPSSNADVKEKVELYFYSLSVPSQPLIG